MNLNQIRKELGQYSDKQRASDQQRFFKTGPGQYGEGDRFMGVRVPIVREVAQKYKLASDDIIISLLQSPLHEERLLALLIWVAQSQEALKKSNHDRVAQIASLYLSNREGINNWDLVDLSCYKILGPAIERKGKLESPSNAPKHVKRSPKKDIIYAHEDPDDFEAIDNTPRHQKIDRASVIAGSYLPKNLWRGFKTLRDFANQGSLWDKRIAMVSTIHFTKLGDFAPVCEMATILLSDREDLTQKAVGWMLREMGKVDKTALEQYLKRFYKAMGRTTLRYAIEHFDEIHRQRYLKGQI